LVVATVSRHDSVRFSLFPYSFVIVHHQQPSPPQLSGWRNPFVDLSSTVIISKKNNFDFGCFI
jgi:hypothetical protein